MDKVKLLYMIWTLGQMWQGGGGVENHEIVLKNQDYKMKPEHKEIMIYLKLKITF